MWDDCKLEFNADIKEHVRLLSDYFLRPFSIINLWYFKNVMNYKIKILKRNNKMYRKFIL